MDDKIFYCNGKKGTCINDEKRNECAFYDNSGGKFVALAETTAHLDKYIEIVERGG